jgi:hypothetical protein
MGTSHRTSASRLPRAHVVNRDAPALTLRNLNLREGFGDMVEPLIPRLRVTLGYAVGLFPIFAVVLLLVALLWAAGMQSSP